MPTLPKPSDAPWHLADALARVVQLREANADGDSDYVDAIAERLELDLGALMQQLASEAA
jgi:hypothetical protein